MTDQRQLEHYDDPVRQQQLATKIEPLPGAELLAPTDLLEQCREQLLHSLGVPRELYAGTMRTMPMPPKTPNQP